jgi:hypothetical protein
LKEAGLPRRRADADVTRRLSRKDFDIYFVELKRR